MILSFRLPPRFESWPPCNRPVPAVGKAMQAREPAVPAIAWENRRMRALLSHGDSAARSEKTRHCRQQKTGPTNRKTKWRTNASTRKTLTHLCALGPQPQRGLGLTSLDRFLSCVPRIGQPQVALAKITTQIRLPCEVKHCFHFATADSTRRGVVSLILNARSPESGCGFLI